MGHAFTDMPANQGSTAQQPNNGLAIQNMPNSGNFANNNFPAIRVSHANANGMKNNFNHSGPQAPSAELASN